MHEEQAKQSEEKNEILQLYEKVQRDIEARKQETQKLKDQMQTEQADVREFISRGTSQFRELLDIEKKDRATQMAETQSDLEALMDKTESDSHQIELMQRIIQDVEYMAVTPLSVYFTAHRAEPYTGGGEEFLTFDGCSVNVGNAMDAKSGIFTAPFSAAYLFSLHVCTHDLKKALIAIRRNGIEVASIYDQNHQDNHKNSMAGQTFVIELSVGDKLQAYMYTFTGLHDKPTNHLTQFTGLLLKPVEHTVDAVRNLTPQPIERSSSSMSSAGGMSLSVPTQNRTRSVLSSERF